MVDKTTIKFEENKGVEIINEYQSDDNFDYSSDVESVGDVVASVVPEIFEKIEVIEDKINNTNVISSETALERLIRVYNESNVSFEDVLENIQREDELFSSALYAKLRYFGLTDDVILSELENIVCFGTQAACMSEEEWRVLFGNLDSTISMYDNVIDYYYPLASYVHRYECELEHEALFFDESRIICSDIEQMLNDKMPEFDYLAYIDEMVKASDNSILISKYLMIVNSGINMDVALSELENIYAVSVIPTGLSEELWNSLFGNLMKTVDDNENVCTFYYDLAYYIHGLWCDLEHRQNEYGTYQCFDEILMLKK